jgi:uncharacterized protein with von Willebrand factor type A (vWA) domain
MEERILYFIAALRTSGVRISLAESTDALNAVDFLGIKDRESFRLSLRSTLIKKFEDISIFDELFPFYFDTFNSPPMMDIAQDLTPEEVNMLVKALQEFNARLRNALERLLNGEQLSREELEQIGKLVGLNNVDEMRYREWMVQRMKRALGYKDIQNALGELGKLLEEFGMNKIRLEELRELLMENQNALVEQLRQFVGQRISENMPINEPDESRSGLFDRPFNALNDREMTMLRKEVQRLALILRTRVALRLKRAKSGQLDAKATIRANLKHGNVPIDIRHRYRTLKPRLVVICDVSTSMRFCSELMLSLVYAIQDQISKTYAFAFIDHLEYVTPELSSKNPNEAVQQVLARLPAGYYNTDLGNSLVNFSKEHIDRLDYRTILIIVGDGRNNYNNPRLDIFKKLTRRSRRTIWLNPEAPALWGTGDSDFLKYIPDCDNILHVSTLKELSVAVDNLLTYK